MLIEQNMFLALKLNSRVTGVYLPLSCSLGESGSFLCVSFFPSSLSPHIRQDAPVTRVQIPLVKSTEAHRLVTKGLLFSSPNVFPPFTMLDRGNVLALSVREKTCHGIGSESVKLMADGLMLQTTYETKLELEAFQIFMKTKMSFWFNIGVPKVVVDTFLSVSGFWRCEISRFSHDIRVACTFNKLVTGFPQSEPNMGPFIPS